MTQPTDTQIEQAIFKFMGNDCPYVYDEHGEMVPIDYTHSLDALVPVVEKLRLMLNVTYLPDAKVWISHNSGNICNDDHEDPSPSRALSLAIYQVIKEQEK